MNSSLAMLTFLMFCGFALPNARHLPLPPQIVAARTVFIENQSGDADIGDRAYDELLKWGRFKVVKDKSHADLILSLSLNESLDGYRTTGGGEIGGIRQPIHTLTIVSDYTRVTFLDAKTGDVLSSDSRRAGVRSATRILINTLRKRLDSEAPQ